MKYFETIFSIVDPNDKATKQEIEDAIKEMCDKRGWSFVLSVSKSNADQFQESLKKCWETIQASENLSEKEQLEQLMQKCGEDSPAGKVLKIAIDLVDVFQGAAIAFKKISK